MTDQNIIDSVLDGHTEMFAHVIRRYGKDVSQFVGRTIRPCEDAEEVAQDVFVKAFQQLNRYLSAKGSLKNWLLGIAWHEVLMYHRKNMPIIADIEPETTLEDYYDEETNRMLTELKEQRINALHEAVSTLMPEDQMLLHLYYAEDLPLKEISEIVGHDHLYLATRLQRIRKKLCAIIKGIER